VAPAEAPPQPVQYVVRAPGRSSTSARFELERGQTGLLVRGERWVVDGRGAPLATHPGSNLVRAERLEEGAGSGFLFIGSAGLFTSPTFDGPLKELATGDFSSVSLGPGFVLASRNDGGARAFDLATGKPRAGLPIGTVLVRTAKDGSAGAITHGGRAYLSVDRAASWRDVTTDVGSPVDLEASEGVLYFIDAAGDAARLEGGSLVRSPAPARPQPKHDPDWSKNESPLEYAVNRGALLEDGRAVAVDGGTIVEISLGTGKIVAREPGALPPQGNCVPQSAGQRILFVCSQSDTSSVFSRPKKGGALKLDKTFGLRGTFLRGRGEALLFVGPCKDSAQKAGVACARTRDGEWVEVDRSAELADTPPGEPLKVIGWAPREGGAYLVVGGKSGGLWDAKTGAKTRLDEDAQKKLEGLFSQSTSSSKPISDRVAVDDQGAIIGLSKDNVGFRVTDGGKQVERSPFRFSQVSSAGNLVLAFDSATGSLWQSSDWGWSYVEVDGPPDPTNTKDTPRACSEAGCAFGQWLRLGWEVVAPSPKAPPKPSSPSLAGTPPKLPQLKCTVSGKATTKELDSPENRLGFGAESHKREGVFLNLFGRSINAPGYGSLDSSALRAAITGKAGFFDTPLPPASLMQSERKIRFVEPFDPKGGVRQSSIKVSELFEAARLSNAPPPRPHGDRRPRARGHHALRAAGCAVDGEPGRSGSDALGTRQGEAARHRDRRRPDVSGLRGAGRPRGARGADDELGLGRRRSLAGAWPLERAVLDSAPPGRGHLHVPSGRPRARARQQARRDPHPRQRAADQGRPCAPPAPERGACGARALERARARRFGRVRLDDGAPRHRAAARSLAHTGHDGGRLGPRDPELPARPMERHPGVSGGRGGPRGEPPIGQRHELRCRLGGALREGRGRRARARRRRRGAARAAHL
jgi:hypothetical protein